MTQRLKSCSNSLNFETIACERYMARLLNREKAASATTKSRERTIKHAPASQNQLTKVRPNVKQQNLPSPKATRSPTRSVPQYTDDSALVEVTVKTTNPRQRSRSTTAGREPWGQLLKQQKSGDKISVFGNFDPLRTLHFLAKELQFQLQAVLPDDSSLQQMVADMQYALKRVPPEIASTVHLQQAIDLIPRRSSSKSLTSDRPEKLKVSTCERVTQTPPSTVHEDNEKLQKIMEESTVKLEASCRQMEKLCTDLKNEKLNLEKQLLAERNNVAFYKKKVDDLELENNEILNPRIKILEEEKRKLESVQRKLESDLHKMEAELNIVTIKHNSESTKSVEKLKSQVDELKAGKSVVEQECNKLKHQIALSALEKEKYVTVLSLRDRQINEIRTEMTQLQEVVNEQLTELHNSAFQMGPNTRENDIERNPSKNLCFDNNKENIGDIGDNSISTIYSNDDRMHFHLAKPQNSFRDLPSGDLDTSNILQEMPEDYFTGCPTKDKKSTHQSVDIAPLLDKLDSHASIRSLFNEVKKTAYAVANSPSRGHSRYNMVAGMH